MTATVKTTIEAGQCVKELAATLGVSTHFVYQMRARGFEMRWDHVSRCTVSTPAEARSWLQKTRFTVRRGRGVIKG